MTFILLGPEEGMKNNFINEIKKDVYKKHQGVEEFTLFSSDGDGIPQFLDELCDTSLFSEYKLLILKEAEVIKKDSLLWKGLCEYAESDDSNITLIYTSTSSSKSVIPPLLLKKVGDEKVKIFYEMTDGQKRIWLQSRSRELGFALTNDAISEILSSVDNTTLEMNALLLSLTSFIRGKKNEISKEDVEEYSSRTKGENGYSLFSALLSCNTEEALLIARSIISEDSTSLIPTLSILSSSFKRLEECLILKERGVNESEIFSIVGSSSSNDKTKKRGGINFKEQPMYKNGMKNYTLKDVKNIICYLGKEDLVLRGAGIDLLSLYLDDMIYTIIKNKGNTTNISIYGNDLLSSPLELKL